MGRRFTPEQLELAMSGMDGLIGLIGTLEALLVPMIVLEDAAIRTAQSGAFIHGAPVQGQVVGNPGAAVRGQVVGDTAVGATTFVTGRPVPGSGWTWNGQP